MSILHAPFIRELCQAADELAHTGWHDNSAGNLSLLLPPQELEPYQQELISGAAQEIEQELAELDGFYLLISASGKRIKHITRDPEDALVLLQICHSGRAWRQVWGLKNGGKPSSELLAHLWGHQARRSSFGRSRVLLHAHPPYTIALSYCMKPDSASFSQLIWKWHPEALAVFPEGIAVLELMLPGGAYLAQRSATELAQHKLVVWATHGVFTAGDSFDDCIGYIEVLEKIIQIAHIANGLSYQNPQKFFPSSLRFEWLTGNELGQLAKHYNVQPPYKL